MTSVSEVHSLLVALHLVFTEILMSFHSCIFFTYMLLFPFFLFFFYGINFEISFLSDKAVRRSISKPPMQKHQQIAFVFGSRQCGYTQWQVKQPPLGGPINENCFIALLVRISTHNSATACDKACMISLYAFLL